MGIQTRKKLKLKILDWAIPLLRPARYKGILGGRGGGKSHQVVELQLVAQVRNQNRNLVCIREVQRSLKDSVKKLFEDKIKKMGLEPYFDIKGTEIRSRKGSGVILFQGMSDSTAESIKSLEGMDCAWVEEAQVLSKRSMELLRPTIRRPDSEIWFTWNPQSEEDPVDKLLCGPKRSPNSIVIKVNIGQNPHASAALRAEAEWDRINDPIKFAHVWGGDYEKHAEARIFRHWRVEEFETPKDAIFRFGADWGFSPDPTVLVRCFIEGRRLFVDYEAWATECEIEDTPDLFLTIPQAEVYNIVAGPDRKDRIMSLRRHGLKVFPAVRGAGSVMEGIEFLRGYDIVIHPRCPKVAEEFKAYKHPIDPLTGKVLPTLPAGRNHTIEALRYAVESVRRFKQGKPLSEEDTYVPPIRHFWGAA